nr:MAG TPA: hypothetical protein [Caudoviricetes sp.]DAY08526.1 MAG TPA: hypothetical protein [Caudoviricetes sp.]
MAQFGIFLILLSLALRAAGGGLGISDLMVPTCVIILALIVCRD